MPIDGTTILLGVMGWPVSHSLSPVLHNTAATALGINAAYVPLPVAPQQLPAAVRGLAALGFRGANVTVPHKEAVRPLLDEVDRAADAIGAVNTIVIGQDGRLHGHNTDWSGFLADLADVGIDVMGRDCVVLGAGGSARAVVYALARSEARLHVLARRASQAGVLADDLAERAPIVAGGLAELGDIVALLERPLIVNTTPLGMVPDVGYSAWPSGLPFPAGSVAYDLVYNPAQTRFLAQAAAQDCLAVNGLGMLVHQAAQAFMLWTGREPDTALMRSAAEEALAVNHEESQ